MREQWKRYRWHYLFAVILLCLTGWSLLRMAIPGKSWAFDVQDLELEGEGICFDANVIAENRPGWYVDSSMEYGDVFTSTPPVDLPAGSYSVTIYYQAEGEGAQYSFSSDVSTFRVKLGRSNQKLESGRISKPLSANFTRKVEGFRVLTHYTGDGYLIVNGIEIKQTRALERMLLTIVCFIGICWLGNWKIKDRRLKKFILCGVGAAAAASLPVMMPYLYDGDDLYFHLLRIEGIAEGLKSGQFPVRIQPEWMNGYGYPVSVFYGEGVLWIAGIFRLIGFPLQLSYKMYLYFVNFITFFIACFSFGRIIKEDRIAMAGAVIYMFAPYRLMNIYVRAAVGEYTALAFLPLVLCGTYEIFVLKEEERKHSWVLLMAGMTGIIQSHILTCLIVALIMGFICLIFIRRTLEKARLFELVKAVIGTVMVNMGFFLPFLDYMRDDLYVNADNFWGGIQTSGTFLNQLFAVFPHAYGASLSIVDGVTGMSEKSFAIGTVFVLGVVLFAIECKKGRDMEKNLRALGCCCCITGIVLLYMSTIWFPWDFLRDSNPVFRSLITKLQFPWRTLGAAGCVFSMVVCIVLKSWKDTKQEAKATALLVVMLGLTGMSAGYFFTSLIETNDVIYVADVESFSSFEVGSGEYILANVDRDRAAMPEGKLWKEEGVEVFGYEKNGTNYVLNCKNLSDELRGVELPMNFYRYYRAEDESTGGAVLLSPGENGRIRLTLAGNYEGTVLVRFSEPISWRFSELISICSIVGIILCLMKKERHNIRSWGKIHAE